MTQIHISSAFRNINLYPNANNFSIDLKNTISKGSKLKLIGCIFENNTASTYYKIVIKECNPDIDGNIGLQYSYIIQNNINGNYIFIDEHSSLNQETQFFQDSKILTMAVYDSNNNLHSFSNDYLLILKVI